MCQNCNVRAAQRDGRLPKDVWYYADVGGSIVGGLLLGIVMLPFVPLILVAAALGWVADKFGEGEATR